MIVSDVSNVICKMVFQMIFIILTAICSSGCYHGTCVSPNSCSCSSGWTGYTCNEGELKQQQQQQQQRQYQLVPTNIRSPFINLEIILLRVDVISVHSFYCLANGKSKTPKIVSYNAGCIAVDTCKLAATPLVVLDLIGQFKRKPLAIRFLKLLLNL